VCLVNDQASRSRSGGVGHDGDGAGRARVAGIISRGGDIGVPAGACEGEVGRPPSPVKHVLSHPPGQLRTHRVELPTKLDKQTTVERFAEPGGVTAEEDEC